MYQGTKVKIEYYLYFQQKSRYGTSNSCCQVGLVLLNSDFQSAILSFQWLSFSFHFIFFSLNSDFLSAILSFVWLSFFHIFIFSFHFTSRKISVSLGVNNSYSFRQNPINLYIFEKLHVLGIQPNWNFVKILWSVTSRGQNAGVGEKGQKKYSKMAYFSGFIE